jgi:hypothetical protein
MASGFDGARARAFPVGFLANDILVRAPQSMNAMFFYI